MQEYASQLRHSLPRLSCETAFKIAHLDQQFRTCVLGEDQPEPDREAFESFWSRGFVGDDRDELPLEIQIGCFLADPEWIGANDLEKTVKAILDETMISDEIEELRRLYLQNIFLNSDVSVSEVKAHLVRDPRWLWVLDPPGDRALNRDEKIELLRLKYEFFEKMGWIKDKTENNPIIRFQLNYLSNTDISLLSLLRSDLEIEQGSEIFLRKPGINYFLISFFYNCYKQNNWEILSQFRTDPL